MQLFIFLIYQQDLYRKLKHQFIFKFTSHIHCRAVVQLHFTTGINSDGHLKTEMASCKVQARHVAMNFSLTDALLLSNYLTHINRFAKERVEEVKNFLQNVFVKSEEFFVLTFQLILVRLIFSLRFQFYFIFCVSN